MTEQVFESNRLIKNLREFMKSEGYPPEQIKRIVEDVHEKEIYKMNKGFKRMQVYLDPKKRLLIKIFDHFRMAVKIRKILRYWVNFSNNRVQWVKADMQEAFRKWAQGDSQRAMDLDRKNYAYLQEKNMKQSQLLINIAEKEHYNDAMIKHLSL